MVMLQKVASLMEGEWSCYRGGQLMEGELYVTEVVS